MWKTRRGSSITLTVHQITVGIAGVGDLSDKPVVTAAGSTAAQLPTDRRIGFTPATTIDDGTADAMVLDAHVLQHHLQVTGSTKLALAGPVFHSARTTE